MDLKVVGLDISHEMLRAAARRGMKNLVQADARFLPFAGGCFDVVMFLESVGYFELDGLLQEAKRVLNRRGRLIMTAYPPHHDSDPFCKKFTLRQIAGELRDSGFRVVDQQMLTLNRHGVIKVASEDCSALLYASAQKKA